MKRIALVFAFLIVISLYGFTQPIKTYTGSYSYGDISGNATYDYYENENYERVYHGNFKFTIGSPEKNKLFDPIYTIIQGKFNNNLKEGLWSYRTEYEEVEGSFVSGLPNGEWVIKKNKEIVENMTFKEGKLIGDFYYKGDGCHCDYCNDVEIKGKINNLGYLDGTWTVKWKEGKVEDIRKYKDGIMYFRLIRNIETGYVGYLTDSTNFVYDILNNLEKTATYSIVKNVKYIVEDSNDDEFVSDAIYKYKRGWEYNEGNIGSSTYVFYDNLICALYNRQGKFNGFKKGEKEIINNYKRNVRKEEQ